MAALNPSKQQQGFNFETIPKWVRWVILLPGSILAYVISGGIVYYIVKSILVGGHDYGSFYEDVGAIPTDIKFAKVLSVFAGSAACVNISYRLAPSKKRFIALLFSILIILIAMDGLILSFPMLSQGYFQTPIKCLVATTAIIVSFLSLPTQQDLIDKKLKVIVDKIVYSRKYLPEGKFDEASHAYRYCEEDILLIDKLYPELSKKQRLRKKEEYVRKLENNIHQIIYET